MRLPRGGRRHRHERSGARRVHAHRARLVAPALLFLAGLGVRCLEPPLCQVRLDRGQRAGDLLHEALEIKKWERSEQFGTAAHDCELPLECVHALSQRLLHARRDAGGEEAGGDASLQQRGQGSHTRELEDSVRGSGVRERLNLMEIELRVPEVHPQVPQDEILGPFFVEAEESPFGWDLPDRVPVKVSLCQAPTRHGGGVSEMSALVRGYTVREGIYQAGRTGKERSLLLRAEMRRKFTSLMIETGKVSSACSSRSRSQRPSSLPMSSGRDTSRGVLLRKRRRRRPLISITQAGKALIEVPWS